MKKDNQILLVFVFLFLQFSFSQSTLKGKIVTNGQALGEIYITNLMTNVKTVLRKEYLFELEAKPSQVLVFSGIAIESKILKLTPIDFTTDLLLVPLFPKTIYLDEVDVKNHPNINAFSLGIISKKAKSYTPAERRLSTAGDFKPIHLLGILAGCLPVDPILNAISGRTARLKKELQVEKRAKLQEVLAVLYADQFYIQSLKIPAEYIKGFQWFALDDPKLIACLTTNNKTKLPFLLAELSEKYQQMIFPQKD